MKNKAFKIFSLLAVLLMLSGCCRINMDVSVNSQAEISAKGEIHISQVQLEQLGKNIEEFRELMVSYGLDFLDETYSFNSKAIDNQIYEGIAFEASSSKFFEAEVQKETVSLLIHDPKEDLEISLANSNGKSLAELMESVNVEATLTIHMPGSIVETDIDKASNKTVIINPLQIDEDIAIISHTLMFDMMRIIVVCLATIVVIIMYAYPLKKIFQKGKSK